MIERKFTTKRFAGFSRAIDSSLGDEDDEPPSTRRVPQHACPACGFNNPGDHGFCLECGVALPRAVPYTSYK